MLNVLNDDTVNPVEPFLRTDRMPHIWCPGCGIGTTVNSFSRALIDSKIDLQNLGARFGYRLHGPSRRIRKARFVSHHARTSDSFCHWPQARQPEAQCRGLLR